MKPTRMLACVILVLSSSFAGAQPSGPDPIAENVFPPELIFQQQQAIGLTDGQKEFLRGEVRQAQAKMTDLQWQLSDEVDKLAALLKQDVVDEQRAIGQLDRILAIERDIKRAQIGLVVRLKNRLTPEQQAKLRELRARIAGK